MAQSVIIQLRNKTKPNITTDTIQVEPTLHVSSLTEYLNSVLNATDEYLFYYESTRIIEDLTSLIENHKIETENTVVIDYLNINDIKEDFKLHTDDYIVSMCLYNGTLYTLLYNGDVIEMYGENFQTSKKVADGIQYIACGDKLYGVKNSKETCNPFVTDILVGNTIEGSDELEDKITSISACSSRIIVGTENKKLYFLGKPFECSDIQDDNIDTKEQVTSLTIDSFYRGLVFTENALYWIESVDIVVKYNLLTHKKSSISTKCVLVNIYPIFDTLYITTSENTLLCIKDGNIYPHKVNLRLVEQICLYKNVIILFSQHNIISVDKDTFEEKFCVFVDDQINSQIICNDNLLVANGSAISGFNMCRFV